jgi:deazaflavin-dependent oxidoreductase (nitroreductase family)
MAKTHQAPRFVRLANGLTKTLLRAGLPLSGFGYPMYLLTVRGRKSGQPHTTPVVIVEQEGKRYLLSPFGVVDWVRNLRASGVATFSRGRRHEQVRARTAHRRSGPGAQRTDDQWQESSDPRLLWGHCSLF